MEANPASVVTFDIATLDTLDAIGAGDAVVGIPTRRAARSTSRSTADLPKVGTLFEPDFEAVAELEPDLIVTAGTQAPASQTSCPRFATTIDLTGAYAGPFDPSAGLERAAQLGEIFGKEDEVAELHRRHRRLVSTSSPDAEGTALVLSVSGGEVGAFGEGSRFGYFFDELGLDPGGRRRGASGAEGSPHGDTVTNEFIPHREPRLDLRVRPRRRPPARARAPKRRSTTSPPWPRPPRQDDHIVYLPASELYIVINGLTAIENVLTSVHEADRRLSRHAARSPSGERGVLTRISSHALDRRGGGHGGCPRDDLAVHRRRRTRRVHPLRQPHPAHRRSRARRRRASPSPASSCSCWCATPRRP